MYALNLAEDRRILSATYPQFAPADAVIVEALPDGNVYDYRYVDGEFVYDPLPKLELPEEEPAALEIRVETLEADSAEMREALEMILSGVTE
jgi:hypothetical protein